MCICASVISVCFTLVVILSSATSSSYITHLVKRQASCNRLHWRCNDGQCIPSYSVCDGLKDCSDGSDETKNACQEIDITCPTNNFQCDYGACLEGTVKCNRKPDCPDGSDERNCSTTGPTTDNSVSTVPDGCQLPEHPEHGSYVSTLCQPGDSREACRDLPGTSVNYSWLLKYSCNGGYNLTSNDFEYSVCENGVWKNPLDCISVTPLSLVSSSSQDSCNRLHWRCNNGQCIPSYSVCDGPKDCSDGSDETKNACEEINFTCPTNNFQCDYGACLEGTVKCNGKPDCPDGSDERNCPTTGPTTDNSVAIMPKSCKLPEHPEHGVYVSTLCQPGDSREACRNMPGTSVNNSWILKYSCNGGYNPSSTDSEYSVCENGVWRNPSDCIKLCEPLNSLSVELKCWYAGREIWCDTPMKPETYATVKCKQHYQEAYTLHSRLVCRRDGTWNYPLGFCKPDCGFSTKPHTLTTLILNGSTTYQGDFPWLAALYLPFGNRWEQQCGGTLITPHIVLTAAHCLVLAKGAVTASGIKVGLGKYYRDYYKQEPNSVIADVREIVIPRYYPGLSAMYALDIGLLDLTVSVQVNTFIMPACVDWQHKIRSTPFEVGHVAGWGITENSIASETALSAQLTFIDNAACRTQVRELYRRFVTHDKFCARSVAGSQVNKGDSGGGLTIVRDQEQHFVIGVVSTKITDKTLFSVFTNISSAVHYAWLEEQTTRLNDLHKES